MLSLPDADGSQYNHPPMLRISRPLKKFRVNGRSGVGTSVAMTSAAVGLGVVGLGVAGGSEHTVILLGASAAGFVVAATVVMQSGARRLLFVLMLANSFLVPMNSLRLNSLMAVSDLFLLLALPLVASMRLQLRYRTPTLVYRRYFRGLVLIAMGGVLAALLAEDPLAQLPNLIRFTASTIGVLWIVAMWKPETRTIRTLVWAYVLGASISVLFGLSSPEAFGNRALGLSPHPNHLGMTSLFGAGAALALAISLPAKRPLRRVLYVLAALCSVGIILSGSRSALVAFACAGLILVVFLRSARFLLRSAVVAIVVATAFSVAAPVLPQLNTNAFDRLFRPSASEMQSDEERAARRNQAVTQIEERPIIGYGFGSALVAHSVLLQLWVAAGILGVVGMAWIGYWSIRLLRQGRGDRLFMGLMATFVAYLVVASSTSNILLDRYIWTFLSLALASAPSEPKYRGDKAALTFARRPSSDNVLDRRSVITIRPKRRDDK